MTNWMEILSCALSVTQYTSILVTHTCLGWGNPCPAGCSPVCCPGWRQQSDTGLWLGWPTPAGPPAWPRETRGCERQKGEAWVKWMYLTRRFFSSLIYPLHQIDLSDCAQCRIFILAILGRSNQASQCCVYRETQKLDVIHLKDHTSVLCTCFNPFTLNDYVLD